MKIPSPTYPSAEAWSLLAGFNATRKCHLCSSEVRAQPLELKKLYWSMLETCGQDWFNFSSTFKPGEDERSPLRDLIGGEDPKYIKPDIFHTFHLGFGADMAASCICWMARLKCFGNIRKFDSKLLLAYNEFMQWVSQNKRYTSCSEFSVDSFKMKKGSLSCNTQT